MVVDTLNNLVNRIARGETFALAQLIRSIEDNKVNFSDIMGLVSDRRGKAYSIGVTGAPGAGKSTIISKLTATIRKEGMPVGILCIDPSSPFSGGALLGDRIRMEQHYLDEGVFIRSIANKCKLGGLAPQISPIIKLLDFSGKDYIFVETVGVGQSEFDIANNVDIVITILTPESGDSIQTMKAGLLEVTDIVVINKADRGAELLAVEFENQFKMLNSKFPIIATTEAINNKGISELWHQIKDYLENMKKEGKLTAKRNRRDRWEFQQILMEKMVASIEQFLESTNLLQDYYNQLENNGLDPYTAADKAFTSISDIFKIQ